MQLKHKGSTIDVALTVNETKLLTKAANVLKGVAMVQCSIRDEAESLALSLGDIVKAIGKE